MDEEEDYLESLIAANTRTQDQLPYPLTVMQARYGGSYEGGDWLAFNCYPDVIDKDSHGDDISCSGFWGFGQGQPMVGRGATPNKAIFDLIKRLGSDG